MPYEARKKMRWGPGAEPVVLEAGDEVPLPIKKVLLKRHVAEVESVSGKAWAEQPIEARDAWSKLNELPLPAHGTRYILEEPAVSVQPASPLAEVVAEPASLPEADLHEADTAELDVTEVREAVEAAPKRSRKKASKKRGRKPRA